MAKNESKREVRWTWDVLGLKSLLLRGQSDTFGLFRAFFLLNVGRRGRENECVYVLVGDERDTVDLFNMVFKLVQMRVWMEDKIKRKGRARREGVYIIYKISQFTQKYSATQPFSTLIIRNVFEHQISILESCDMNIYTYSQNSFNAKTIWFKYFIFKFFIKRVSL